MSDYLPDDAMSEAAAFRHAPPNRKYQARPDDVELKVRLSKNTFDALNAMKDEDRSVEAYVRRLLKDEVKRWRKAETLHFLIDNQHALRKLINNQT